MAQLMVYGATGYTGRLICEQAKKVGLDFTVSGRSAQKLSLLAAELEVPYDTFSLDAEDLDAHLRPSRILLNCAGPFVQTARILMEACLRCKTHYLDVSAELNSYLDASGLEDAARQAGVMLLPGCGGSVAMLGCLAAHATKDVVEPTKIEIAMHVAGSMSRGSAISAAAMATGDVLRMVKGQIVPQESSKTATFDFGDGRGAVPCFAVTLPDLVTLLASTGCHNIETFVNISADAFPNEAIVSLPDGPTNEERAVNPYHAAVKVEDASRLSRTAVLHTVNGYTFTAIASVEASRRVLRGTNKPGWRTPVEMFGQDFFDAIPDTAVFSQAVEVLEAH